MGKQKAAPAKPQRVSTLAGHEGEVIQDVSDWLNKGCPVCHAKLLTDTPVYQRGTPGLYPALLWHFGTVHEGMTPPEAPHPEDEAALDTPVIFGMNQNGTPRMIPYRQALAEAVAAWHAGAR